MAGHVEEDWIELSKMCNEANFDLIELNLSCPHGMTERGLGRACGEDPNIVRDISKWVSSTAKMPVIVKVTPNHSIVSEIALAAQEGGAHAVCLTNTMPSLMDPETSGKNTPSVGRKGEVAFGGAAGSILRPFALKKCAEVAINSKIKIPIFGSGGIISGDHALA